MQPAQSQVQNTKFALSQKYMIEAKKQSKMQSRQTFKFLVQNTRAGLFMNQCKIHIKFSLVQSTRNKIKISQKYKKILWCKKHSTSYPGKNTLFQVSVKSTLPNCQSKVMPFTLLVQSHALYTNSLKYIVKNEPSPKFLFRSAMFYMQNKGRGKAAKVVNFVAKWLNLCLTTVHVTIQDFHPTF